VLELLASCRDGCTEAIMIAHGFSIEQMVELLNARLATATAERVVAGGQPIEVARVRITEAGWRVLVGAVRTYDQMVNWNECRRGICKRTR
jgi:hypothetical protein